MSNKIYYSFMPSIEYIKETMDLSPHDKLIWLERAKEFVRKFVSEDQLRLWDGIRHGKVEI